MTKTVMPEQDRRGLAQSLWAATAEPAPDCPPLDADRRADVAVVGAGFAGLSTALHLAERGIDVVVLEAEEPGFGASGRNGGQVIGGLKHDFEELSRLFDPERADRMVAFADTAADFTFGLIERHEIQCDARQGGFVQGAHGPGLLKRIEAKVAGLAARGAPVSALSAAETRERTGTDFYHGAFHDPRGGTINPLGYARGLARAALAAGAAIHGKSPVSQVARDGAGWRVTVADGPSVRAERVLFCTNGYSNVTDPRPEISRSVVPFYSYQIATKPLSHNLLKSLPADGVAVSEFRRILSYYRIDAQGRFLMGARGALDGSLRDGAFDLARTRMAQLFPFLADQPLEHFWNGRVAVTTDHLPRLVEPEPGLHAAVGWNGRGVAMTSTMGPLLADWLTGTAPRDLPMPVTPPRPIPFHWLHRPVAGLAVAWKNFQDERERRQTA
jgi:glycine/D-amino acid oxidase-like deaminating enzyme